MKSADKPVTDIQFLVKLGYPEEQARIALQKTRGDRNAAIYILIRSTGFENQKDLQNFEKWRKCQDDDWLSGVTNSVLSNSTVPRAIQKSPIYIRVGSVEKRDGNKIEFVMNISLKDGRHWNRGRTYTEFFNFRASMPFGSCNSFDNRFPLPLMTSFMKLFSQEPSDESLEKKRYPNFNILNCLFFTVML